MTRVPQQHSTSSTGIPAEALARLLGSAPEEMVLLGGGGNSRVYRVTCSGGPTYALKAYYRNPDDPRDRLGVEFGALGFLWDRGLRSIPRPVAADPVAGLGLLEFIPGARVARPSPAEIDDACRFLADLHRLSAGAGAAALPPASEACFSFQAVAANIQARLDRLRELDATFLACSGLGPFLADELLPAWKALRADCVERCRRWAIPFDQALPESCRTLSPSDFGFHNALRAQDRMVFIDFEYFGWDDPAKMLVDFLLHPGMALEPSLRARFARGLLDRLPLPGLRERARVAYPLFGLKWCAILLNEFLPGPLQRRRFAEPSLLSPTERQARQLDKCRSNLQQVLASHDHFTLFDAPT